MKKIYMPSDEVLSEIQSYGGDIYKYLLVKSYELLMIAGSNYYEDVDMDNLRTINKVLPYNIELSTAAYIALQNKSLLKASDYEIIKQILMRSDFKIKDLNILANYSDFSSTDIEIINLVITLLAKWLPRTPVYRFEYQEGQNNLLSDIFSTKIIEKGLPWNYDLLTKISKIEPAYAVLIKEVLFEDKMIAVTNRKRRQIIKNSIDEYVSRYKIGFHDYEEKTDRHEEVKRLVKFIKSEKTNLY